MIDEQSKNDGVMCIPPQPTRNFRVLYVTPELIFHALTLTEEEPVQYACRVISPPLPGAKCAGVHWDNRRQCFAIYIEHPSFAPVEYGKEIPQMPPPVLQSVKLTEEQMRGGVSEATEAKKPELPPTKLVREDGGRKFDWVVPLAFALGVLLWWAINFDLFRVVVTFDR